MKGRKRKANGTYQAALEAVRRLTDRQRLRLLGELQHESLSLNLAELKIDTELSGLDLYTDLTGVDLKVPHFDFMDLGACLLCGRREH